MIRRGDYRTALARCGGVGLGGIARAEALKERDARAQEVGVPKAGSKEFERVIRMVRTSDGSAEPGFHSVQQ